MSVDQITGNFPGWQYFTLVLGFLFLLGASVLFFMFMKAKKDRLFSYRTVACLGISFFFFVLAILRIADFIVHGDDGTFYLTLVSVAHSPVNFLVYTFPLTLVFSLILIISNARLIMKEGFYPSNLYAVGFGIVVSLLALFGLFLNRDTRALVFSNAFVIIYSGIFCYYECLFAAVMACTLYAGMRTPAYGRDYIIVLGCAIRRDGSLPPLARLRTDRALEYSRSQEKAVGKKAILIPSGGKGDDEPMSEAQAMKNYLLSEGLDESRILIEDRSTTTRENMRFSRNIINSLGGSSGTLFSTSSFHVFRSGMLARSEGFDKIDGIGAKTVWYFWPNAFVREFIGLLSSSWKTHVLMMLAVSAFSLLLTAML